MQPIKQLTAVLANLADTGHYLFTTQDLTAAVPEQSEKAFRAMLGRAAANGLIHRVCHGLYLNPRAQYTRGLTLYHAAARLRADEFNYLSLESVLSDAGVISQIPMNWISLMTSGRNYVFDCGAFGHIEFIHSKRPTATVENQLTYDPRLGLWRASVALALKDMNLTRRSTELIDWEVARELV